MVLCKLLMLLFIFNEHVDALTCPKGHKVSIDGNRCETCPEGFYQAGDNDSQMCKLCTKCYDKYWSDVKKQCTTVTDTTCECRGGFVPLESDSSECKCDIGSGLKGGVCSECEEGYFSTSINSKCRRWTDCKSAGVKTKGSQTSDVVCDDEPNTHTSTSTTSHTVDTLTHLKSHLPHEGARTQRMLTAVTTTAAPRVTSGEKEQPPSTTSTPFGVGPPILVIAGILLLAVVTCKLYNTPCRWGKTAAQKKDSCRRPVEEIGDGSRSCLKYPEEP